MLMSLNLMGLSSSIRALSLIDYTGFNLLPSVDDDIFVRDKGKFPKYNLAMHSGNPLDWQGTQYSDITLPDYSNMYIHQSIDGVITTENLVGVGDTIYSLGKVNGSGTLIDAQQDYAIITENELTTEQQSMQSEYPNKFFKEMVDDVNTLFATDFRGKLGYIADSNNYVEGNEVSDWDGKNLGYATHYNCTATQDTTFGLVDNTSIKFVSTVTGANLIGGIRIGDGLIDTLTNGEYYKCSWWIYVADTTDSSSCTTNVSTNTSKDIGDMSQNVVKGEWTEYSTIFKYDDSLFTGALVFRIAMIGVTSPIEDTVFWVSAPTSVKRVEAVYPIVNYSETQRTNFTQEPTGLQDLLREFNSNGFFVDNIEYLNCTGIGYGDTNYIPSDDFYIETITTKDGVYKYTVYCSDNSRYVDGHVADDFIVPLSNIILDETDIENHLVDSYYLFKVWADTSFNRFNRETALSRANKLIDAILGIPPSLAYTDYYITSDGDYYITADNDMYLTESFTGYYLLDEDGNYLLDEDENYIIIQ